MEFLQTFLRLLAFDRLRLVDNQNRIRLGDDINRSAGTELVELHVNASRVLSAGVKRLRIDNHHIDGAVGGKTIYLSKLRGVVDEKAYLLPVFLGKVVLRHLKRLVNALADGDRRHDHDELRPTVGLIQLVHGLDVGIGFSDAGLHLDGQVVFAFELLGRLDLPITLDLPDMLKYLSVGQFWHDLCVRPAREVIVLVHAELIGSGSSIHHVGGREVWLPGKDIHDGFGGVSLKLLMLELQLHSATSLNDLDSCIRRKGLENLADIDLLRAADKTGVTEHGAQRLTLRNRLDNRLWHVLVKACNQIPIVIGMHLAAVNCFRSVRKR